MTLSPKAKSTINEITGIKNEIPNQNQLQKADPLTEPIHHLITYLGIHLFPFLMKPVLMASGTFEESQFIQRMKERQVLAPIWMAQLLNL